MDDRPDLKRFFADCYSSARAKFLDLTSRLGWEVASHEIAARGPAGEPLHIDVAASAGAGGGSPWQTVIVSSGLHGVEGYFGSAVQCAGAGLVASGQHRPDAPAHIRARLESIWLRVDSALQRGQRRSQSQFSAEPGGLSRQPGRLCPVRPDAEPTHAAERLGTVSPVGAIGDCAVLACRCCGGPSPPGNTIIRRGCFTAAAVPAKRRGSWKRSSRGGSARRPARCCISIFTPDWAAGTNINCSAICQCPRLKPRGSYTLWAVKFEPAHNPDRCPIRPAAASANGVRSMLRERDYTYLCAEFGTKPSLTMLAAVQAEPAPPSGPSRHGDVQLGQAVAERGVLPVLPPLAAIRRRAGVGSDPAGNLGSQPAIERLTCRFRFPGFRSIGPSADRGRRAVVFVIREAIRLAQEFVPPELLFRRQHGLDLLLPSIRESRNRFVTTSGSSS